MDKGEKIKAGPTLDAIRRVQTQRVFQSRVRKKGRTSRSVQEVGEMEM